MIRLLPWDLIMFDTAFSFPPDRTYMHGWNSIWSYLLDLYDVSKRWSHFAFREDGFTISITLSILSSFFSFTNVLLSLVHFSFNHLIPFYSPDLFVICYFAFLTGFLLKVKICWITLHKFELLIDSYMKKNDLYSTDCKKNRKRARQERQRSREEQKEEGDWRGVRDAQQQQKGWLLAKEIRMKEREGKISNITWWFRCS